MGRFVPGAVWLYQKWTQSVSLQQLRMDDNSNPKGSFLYSLSTDEGLSKFENVYLVGSSQDLFVSTGFFFFSVFFFSVFFFSFFFFFVPFFFEREKRIFIFSLSLSYPLLFSLFPNPSLPFSSALIDSAVGTDGQDDLIFEMIRNIFGLMYARNCKVTRIEVVTPGENEGWGGNKGRTAHINFLDSRTFIEMFVDYFFDEFL